MAGNSTGDGDELARTATAAASASAGGAGARAEGLVGRYRLERELGAGAMGVVHAAFDPDLERRIALKVLRVAAPGLEAKDRLLREARAMARLAHPNVVTVHEVGTTNGRDYIAMELIQGETLADWLRATRRRPADILAAFLAAGRGLAAAHAAGIVHRDFKPHNVLRSRDGRIVVTDFGLAREAQAGLPAHLETTLPLGAAAVSLSATGSPSASGSPSALAGITVTGSLLGTPAYMAPEQWSGGAVTPATDQFAYCVALWEALAGERPYRGPTLDDLRKQAALGPGALDASRIPRRLRATLRRGLDPDPLRRWPSMDALLARLVRVERRAGIALVIVAGAAAGALVLALAMRAGHEMGARPACDPPALDPVAVWSPAARADAGKQTSAAARLDADLAAWSAARAAACEVEAVARAPRLQCLDGVLARLDAVALATRAARDGAHVDAGELLIDPLVCELARPPRLMTATTPEFRDAVAVWLERTATPVPLGAAAASALLARTAQDPCASALAHLLAADIQKTAAERNHHLDEAQQDAERCGDDRVMAEVALASSRFMIGNEWLSAAVTTKLRRAESAVVRVAQRDLTAEIDLLRVEVARRAENLDEAIRRGGVAIQGFAVRGRLRAEIRAGLAVLALRQLRASPEDQAAIPIALAAWRARAVAELGEADECVRAIDHRAALRTMMAGDVARAHAELVRLWRPLPNDPHQAVSGVVIDARGQPVAGATVAAGWSMQGDSVSAIGGTSYRGSLRRVTTGPDGRFEIPDAVPDGVVIAERGDQRSLPVALAREVVLALAPTSRLEGRVELPGGLPTNLEVAAWDDAVSPAMRYALTAPVAPDGSFTLDGVPRGTLRVLAGMDGLATRMVAGQTVAVRGPVVRGVVLSGASSSRVVHVLVRSTVNVRLDNAQVFVMPGKVLSMTALEINDRFRAGSIRLARQLEGEHAPKPVVAAAQPGDLFATMTEVPTGPASACALGLPGLSDDELVRKVLNQLDKLHVICVPIPSDGDVVAVEIPPLPRLD